MGEAALRLEPTVSDLIETILDYKATESELNKRLSQIKEERKAVERQVIEWMQDQGLERTGIGAANVSVQRKRHPQVTDWDAFYEFIYKNNAAYLMQRRVSSTAVEEFVNSGEDVPGIEYYEEDVLSVRRR